MDTEDAEPVLRREGGMEGGREREGGNKEMLHNMNVLIPIDRTCR